MTQIEQRVTTSLIYESSSSTSSRIVYPIRVPDDAILALDLSDLDPADRTAVTAAYDQYAQYVEQFMQQMFNFETWLDHTSADPNIAGNIKWRKFKLAKIK